jgi:hypothetical protein
MLEVVGQQSGAFERVFSGFVAIAGRHWTSPEVYGVGTADRHITKVSHCFRGFSNSHCLKMPPSLPLPNVGCLEKALDVGSGFTEAQSRDASRCASQGAFEAHLGGTPSDACLIGSVPSSAS